MKKNIYYTLLFVTTLLVTTACNYVENELTPSDVTDGYSLPQGNHDYDNTILDFYQKYGTYLLYQFTDKDACWTPSGWNRFDKQDEYTSVPKQGYLVKPADPAYVKQQLALLDEVWFSKLSEKAKEKLLPVKILLCSEVDSCYVEAQYTYDWSTTPFTMTVSYNEYINDVKGWYNYDNICIGWGNSDIQNITESDKKALAYKIFHIWPDYIGERLAEPTEEFAKSIDYANLGNVSYIANCCAKGILFNTYNGVTPAKDWARFMLIMMNFSYDWLTDENITAPGQYDDWTNWANAKYGASYVHEAADYHGLLSSVKDVNGILKRRYQMVRQYFIDEYDMDLQEIGNAQ